MEGTLDYNVRLAELQQNAAKLAARTLGKKEKICAFIIFHYNSVKGPLDVHFHVLITMSDLQWYPGYLYLFNNVEDMIVFRFKSVPCLTMAVF